MITLVEKEGFTFIINQKMLNKFKTKYVTPYTRDIQYMVIG